jgi:hypothetical protein
VIDPSRFDDPNLAMLEIAVQALGDLCESLVFVGGCATGLLVSVVGNRFAYVSQATVPRAHEFIGFPRCSSWTSPWGRSEPGTSSGTDPPTARSGAVKLDVGQAHRETRALVGCPARRPVAS